MHIEGRRDPQFLIDPGHYPNAVTIQHHLLEELIPAAVRNRPPLPSGEDPLRPKRHHDPDKVRRWLTTLATELRDAQTRDWRWWQLAWHTVTSRQIGQEDAPSHTDLRLRGRATELGSELGAGLVVGLVAGWGPDC